MSTPPTNSDSDDRPDEPTDSFDDDVDADLDDGSEDAGADPDAARREAEEALAKVEALADLDDDPDPSREDDASVSGAAEGSSSARSSEDTDTDAGERCGNCGAPVDGPYCSECGQKVADRVVPLWYMFNDALETVFNLDLRAFRTFPKLFFLPGRLTKEYVNGRRKRYVRPFRLYLVATFLLFATIAVTTTGGPFSFIFDPQGAFRLNPPNTGVEAGSGAAPDTTLNESMFGSPAERRRQAKKIRSDTTLINLNIFDDPEANERLEAVVREKVAQATEDPRGFIRGLIDRGPYLMFLMLPIFALLLKLLYIRRGRLYMEHLIFSLHTHAFAFFAFSIGVVLHQSSMAWVEWIALFIELSPLLYLVLAMSHVYEQGLIKSSIKAILLLWIYSLTLSIAFAFFLVLVILWL